MSRRSRLLLTMGDVAGVGPEIIARAWPALQELCEPVVVGDSGWMSRALRLVGSLATVQRITACDEARPTEGVVPVLAAGTVNVDAVETGKVSAVAGRAAYDFLCRACDDAIAGRARGIVTAPLHKEGLRRAGVSHPGHTEILADRTGTKQFGMMLYVRTSRVPHGLGVVHVTLHMALKEVFEHLTQAAVLEKIRLLEAMIEKLGRMRPRLAVLGLNPHAGDGGLFGDEEKRLIEPAVEAARAEKIDVSGPWPADTLFVRAAAGDFDGVVAMYHDQGHIALKLLGGWHAVNVTVGLPIVRTSVAHGTAYDIAGQGVADPASMIEAVRLAALLTRG
jgi:4-hydroxythreonine-4-phosphate dehydrogenase